MTPLINQAAVGAVYGFADFIICTTYQKICLLAGVIFKEIEDDDDIPASERLDKEFWQTVVIWPIGEEIVFRGILQPILAHGILFFMPQLSAPSYLGIAGANLISSVVTGTGFGAIHYFVYSSGGKEAAFIISVGGIAQGILKERFGLVAPICAHMVHNFMVGWLDKQYPEFLEQT